jgi:hypothetical protein
MASSVVRSGVRRVDNFFFSGMGALVLLVVFLGFAHTYYMAGVFHAPLPNLLIHVHAVVFSAWIVVFIAQISLVSAGRTDLHRRLGLLGFGVACLVVLLGLMASADRLERHAAPGGETAVAARTFYAIPTADMLAFSVLIYFGFRERSHPAAHKRLMLIATVAILDAAFVRWPIPVSWWHRDMHAADVCCYILLLLLIGYDLWSLKKIHRATLWATMFLVVLHQLRVPIGRTAPWQAFAAWVEGIVHSLR